MSKSVRTRMVEVPIEEAQYRMPCGSGCRGSLTISNVRQDLLRGGDFYYDCGECGRHGVLINLLEKRGVA